MCSTPKAPIDPETGEPEEVEAPNEYETENVLSDATMLSAVGVGFTQTEWYNIMLSIKKLGEDPVKLLKTVRKADPCGSTIGSLSVCRVKRGVLGHF